MAGKRLHKIVKRALQALDMEVYTRTAVWPRHPEFVAARQRIEADGVTKYPVDRCFILFRLAQSLRDVEGDIIECGSRYGRSTRFILDGFGMDSAKKLHVFDSFEGLSEPGQEDIVLDEGGEALWSKHDLAVGVDEFKKNIAGLADKVVVHKGWIPERFHEVEDKTFCLAHIDVDLYQPTLDTLKFVYDRMPPRGVIICDDYGSFSCPGARRAFDEFFSTRPENVIELSSIQALVVKA
ncbi:MAG: TylF/MycF/NovP-related O-methyltransferase [Hyphomicrobiales bacterium]